MDPLCSVFNHLVLPPKIPQSEEFPPKIPQSEELPPKTPQSEDVGVEIVSRDVLIRIIRACEATIALAAPPWTEAFQSLEGSLSACLALNTGRLDRSTMLKYFRRLQQYQTLILHVVEQNAALLIRREIWSVVIVINLRMNPPSLTEVLSNGQQYVIFEAFEASAVSEEVLAAPQALQWDFPGRSARIPLADFADEQFQESLAVFLEQASMESLHNLQAQTQKANVSVIEERDTTDPALITQMLLPLLEAMGNTFQSPTLRKRVRDDVNFGDADIPWRRLPFWLILRVASQHHLYQILGNVQGRTSYKYLICMVLADLLKDSASKLSPDMTITLRAKLCRRMAKLEMESSETKFSNADNSECLSARIGPLIQAVIREATVKVETAWESFKQTTMRHVPNLPLRSPDSALHLLLPNSGIYLDSLLSNMPLPQTGPSSLDLPQTFQKDIKQTQDFTDHLFRLTAMEQRINHDGDSSLNTHDPEGRCIKLAQQIDEVFVNVGSTYDSDPEQMSAMILTVFNLWVRLDECALVACPLLQDYAPAFSPELLDALQLPTLASMRRLQEIQEHLARRCARCQYGTILDLASKDCLAVRYVAQSAPLQSLGSRIQSASDQARKDKAAEWESVCKKYDELTEAIDGGICLCSWENNKRVDVGACTKCFKWRSRNRLKIEVHESFLPENDLAKAVLLFELAIPRYLSAYRDATWRILQSLAHPSRPIKSSKPEIELRECKPLLNFMSKSGLGIGLASTVKCFVQTHYKFNHSKVPVSRVFLPFAAKFELYDHASGLWVRDLDRPLTLQHLCGVFVPRGLENTVLPRGGHPAPCVDGPSSYQIQANQTKCPSNMSFHEFSAYQKLLAGKTRRWPTILVEMDSSNLNFSDEDTTRVICQLAIQAGPQLTNEVLRAPHVIFHEQAFLDRLIQVIEKRFGAISTNWREHNCMQLLITLSLRLFSLSSGLVRARAESLLHTARDVTLNWTTILREEVQNATDADTAQRTATYGFYAALLCRQTFAMSIEFDRELSAEDLASWVQASIALQENLWVDINKLPSILKSLLIRDTKMAYCMQHPLEKAISAHPSSIGHGIARSWSDSLNGISRTFSQWTVPELSHNRWIVATMSEGDGRFVSEQTVHLNIVEGHLLINLQPCGKLPLEFRDDPHIKDMFGSQHLLTYPSSLPGMTHRLATRIHNQEIHFGLRDGEAIIRARSWGHVLEFIPKEVFSGSDSFDLPAELVDNCRHWLNLDTRCLEVRRATWYKRPRDWEVNVPERRAFRSNSTLVDPRSPLASDISQIFQHFAPPEKLTIYQPQARVGRLSVELRHLELSFFVNDAGLLECRQFKAEIDPNQDFGSWYGLLSKIVLRDVVTGERSVLVPIANVMFNRRDIHVEVRTKDAREYGRYKVDDILGRLSSPPEPRLIYMKALCHAFTSFCLPDNLTGRTGTEEAFSILRSAAAQPWIPIAKNVHPTLNAFITLLPTREYYPANVHRLQKVIWHRNLTPTIQHDGYESLIRNIKDSSNRLNRFVGTKMDGFVMAEQTHLRRRGEVRRQLYERPMVDTCDYFVQDRPYVPRDRRASSKAINVYETARLILARNSPLRIENSLKSILETWPVIGGFYCEGNSRPALGALVNQIEDPIPEQWGNLVNFCRGAESQAPLLFRLGLLAFGADADMEVVRSLIAFGSMSELKDLEPPVCDRYVDFNIRGRPSPDWLENLITRAHTAFEPLGGRSGSHNSAGRHAQAHKSLCEEEGRRLVKHLLQQWPALADKLSADDLALEVVDIGMALETISTEWTHRRENEELEGYINQVQAILDSRQGPPISFASIQWVDKIPTLFGTRYGPIVPSMAQDLVVKPGLCSEDLTVSVLSDARSQDNRSRASLSFAGGIPVEVSELDILLNKFAGSASTLRQQYGNDLLQSLNALKAGYRISQPDAQTCMLHLESVRRAVEQANDTMGIHLARVRTALAASDPRAEWLQLADIWPSTTATAMLELLGSRLGHRFGPLMKEALVSLGLVVTTLQQLRRVQNALLQKDERIIDEELRNAGHQNWKPLDVPDWLLIEIDSDSLIRAEQVDVAWAIIAPASGENSVLQMLMGQGKTSFIVPMVIAVLADGDNLSRLIVPQPLLMQTAQVVQSKLGGLVGRQVRHIPFSRKTSTALDMLKLYEELHRDICDAKGLLLTSHQHILSYKLGGWQQLADGKLNSARIMIDFQGWLNDHCRDVLDECDFTLSVKTQLNYPSGPETTVDGHPFRWQVAQGLLDLVANHIRALSRQFPCSIEMLERPGSFPAMQFLNRDVEDALHDRILDDICVGRVPFLRFNDQVSSSSRTIVRCVISEHRLDQGMFKRAISNFKNPQIASKILLTVRGLLLNRILLLCLDKRWNVQYGLAPQRHPVAVPFDAKCKPSDQAEFGHPDVAILFTCLAFYYNGLTTQQFRQELQHVLQSNDPAAQYESWTSGREGLPDNLRHWNMINTDDDAQVNELWGYLRLDRIVVNHYLNHAVFPAHAKQFDIRLQASAWDVILFSGAQSREARTTGFSGTNDNRMMLPLTIRQGDLPALQQTSAEVLSYFLQPRNRAYQTLADNQNKRLSEVGFLERLHATEIRLLIDAGAYVLEMDNKTLVQKWLAIDHSAKAAVYFRDDNRAWILHRDNTKSDIPLLATPYADDLSDCVVYLDQAHTRGTDLRLPLYARGALTLALKQTKDFTVQAAMRLRQLGTTQSISFFAPPEVVQSIYDFCRPTKGENIDALHIVSWLLEQTCRNHEDLQGLYITQGIDFLRRTDATWRYHNFLHDTTDRARLLEVLQQPERQTLEQMYGESLGGSTDVTLGPLSAAPLQSFADQLNQLSGRRSIMQTDALAEVEQERELQNEVEQVRQVQKPRHYKALQFPRLHPAVLQFARSGTLDESLSSLDAPGFEQAFEYVSKTSIGRQFRIRGTNSRLFVSAEFGRTISCEHDESVADNFLRPVEWILWSRSTETALVIIPEEAEEIIPVLRLAASTSLVHLIAYATPVTKDMIPFNDLQYYTLPRIPPEYRFPEWFQVELGILAGRLYMDKDERESLTRYLRSPHQASYGDCPSSAGSQVADGLGLQRFAEDPAAFLLEWLPLRRKAQDISHTHVGLICTGQTPEEDR